MVAIIIAIIIISRMKEVRIPLGPDVRSHLEYLWSALGITVLEHIDKLQQVHGLFTRNRMRKS